LVEAGPALLGPFDAALQKYAHGLFEQRDIDVRLRTAVTGVEDFEAEDYHFTSRRAMLSDGSEIEFGTMVWSAGLAPRTFTSDLAEDGKLHLHPRNKRILTDEYLRVKGYEGSIWAIGDAAVTENGVALPQLAQVARQQGLYLTKIFNGQQKEDEKEFRFFSLGSMAYLGDMKGIYDGTSVGEPGKEIKNPKIRGLAALFMWRFAYWGRQTSWVNKMLIPMHWFKAFVFGRYVSEIFRVWLISVNA
jgi:NADH dehydrogenase FAD-containing subunit